VAKQSSYAEYSLSLKELEITLALWNVPHAHIRDTAKQLRGWIDELVSAVTTLRADASVLFHLALAYHLEIGLLSAAYCLPPDSSGSGVNATPLPINIMLDNTAAANEKIGAWSRLAHQCYSLMAFKNRSRVCLID
jgi:hypothetical protein